jgi:glycosyltransferase involved in cell wall biosynthesis
VWAVYSNIPAHPGRNIGAATLCYVQALEDPIGGFRKELHVINGKRVVVVMPAYNAAKTLEKTVRDLPDIVDTTIVVDDGSADHTVKIARALGLLVFVHDKNYGYGRNQQTCYREALGAGADIVVMVHPDYQYTPKLVTAMASMIGFGVYEVVLGSRILGGGALRGGMPFYKYAANRFLTAIQNVFTGAKLSEYHTGFRAFAKEVLTTLPLLENSDDFVFDNEMLAQCLCFGYKIGELSCPANYFGEASSIPFGRSVHYGFGVLQTTFKCWLQRLGIVHYRLFSPRGRKLLMDYYLPASTPEAREQVRKL